MARTGVPAAISLAQGIVESGAGTTWLAVHANNQFGLKCKNNWQGESVRHDDDRKSECFRKYAEPEDSWRDYLNFLKVSPRYQFLFKLDPLDFKAWAYGLKQAGYATNNRYARQLIKTIQQYHLNQYSKEGLALAEKQKPDDNFSALLNKKIEQNERNKGKTPSKEDLSYPQGILTINKKSALFLPAGTQLISIADKYDIPLRRLLRFNELKTDVLSQSMLIFIEKKRKRGSHKKHVVETGETYHNIAQQEGIRLKWLLKRNELTGEAPPQPGDVLMLTGYVNKKGGSKRISGLTHFFRKLFGSKKEETPSNVNTLPKQSESQPSDIQPEEKGNQNYFFYRVKSGDTLYQLSKKFHIDLEELKSINHLKKNIIKVNQKLKIPKKN